jgi:hypothetical protein
MKCSRCPTSRPGLPALAANPAPHSSRAPRLPARAAFLIRSLLLAAACLAPVGSHAGPPAFDFTQASGREGWSPTHDLSDLSGGAEGMVARISGTDPYLSGPARDYPAGKLLWLHIRLRSDQAGGCQVFFYQDHPTEEKSVRIQVPGGEWHETRVPMPALGPGFRLRIDPPGQGGQCVFSRLWFTERVLFAAPSWPTPPVPAIRADALRLTSGALELRHSREALGAFAVEVQGRRLAIGNTAAMLGYVVSNEARWMPLRAANGPAPTVEAKENAGFSLSSRMRDPDGGNWTFTQRFEPKSEGAIAVETEVSVDRDRQVLYLPMFALLPGVGAYGTNKHQALFSGVEYLENEPSSSEADLKGPSSWRKVPDTLKITFPLMAIEEGGRYVGLVWEPEPRISAVFDSPDREFNSGGHLMGLLFPGSDGSNREERSLTPYSPERIRAGDIVRLRALILGGRGNSVMPAVRQFVALKGLPAAPDPGLSLAGYSDLAAHGWLESRIREGDLFRHAYWPGFGPQPAADAALWMRWLSTRVTQPALAARLTEAAAGALARVEPPNYNAAQVGHIRFPAPALAFGSVLENVTRARTRCQDILGSFEPDGTVSYRTRPGAPNYAETHWAPHANGLTAAPTLQALELAAFCGDPALLDRALKQLRRLNQYRDTVPRGAQTWEIPLHTPDILASACLVKAYTLGYELTGDEAKYWAWTGVPFIYLHPPVHKPIGLYSTIPVLGATGWVAPVWIGLPVQWCGLVYADALYRFARHDPSGPWLQLADGISAVGIQHSWPMSDPERGGLLPDVFHLRAQFRDGPAINPATLQAPALRLFRQRGVYDFFCSRRHGLRVHAPGDIAQATEQPGGIRFVVRPWSAQPSRVLVNGFREPPRLKIDGQSAGLGAPHQYSTEEGILVIRVEGEVAVDLECP